jgi:hypothetical protein
VRLDIKRDGDTVYMKQHEYQTVEILVHAMAQTIETLLPFAKGNFPKEHLDLFKRQIEYGRELKAKLYDARDLTRGVL